MSFVKSNHSDQNKTQISVTQKAAVESTSRLTRDNNLQTYQGYLGFISQVSEAINDNRLQSVANRKQSFKLLKTFSKKWSNYVALGKIITSWKKLGDAFVIFLIKPKSTLCYKS